MEPRPAFLLLAMIASGRGTMCSLREFNAPRTARNDSQVGWKAEPSPCPVRPVVRSSWRGLTASVSYPRTSLIHFELTHENEGVERCQGCLFTVSEGRCSVILRNSLSAGGLRIGLLPPFRKSDPIRQRSTEKHDDRKTRPRLEGSSSRDSRDSANETKSIDISRLPRSHS